MGSTDWAILVCFSLLFIASIIVHYDSSNNIQELFSTEGMKLKRNKESQKYEGLVDSLLPLGSIIPWAGEQYTGADVPAGWQKCNGSVIKQGPMAGKITPDLNGKELFIRGGSDKDAGTIEEDAVEDHGHVNPGHTHTDSGHTHTQVEHSHKIDGKGEHFPGFLFHYTDKSSYCSYSSTQVYNGVHYGKNWCVNWNYDTGKSTPYIYKASASIQASTVDIGAVSGGKSASETRPKNIRLEFIMRIA